MGKAQIPATYVDIFAHNLDRKTQLLKMKRNLTLTKEQVNLLVAAFHGIDKYRSMFGFYHMASLFGYSADQAGWNLMVDAVRRGGHEDALRGLAGSNSYAVFKMLEAKHAKSR